METPSKTFANIERKPIPKPDTVRDFDTRPESALVRPNEIAVILGCSAATVWRMFQNGTLTRRKIGVRMTGATVGEVRELINGGA